MSSLESMVIKFHDGILSGAGTVDLQRKALPAAPEPVSEVTRRASVLVFASTYSGEGTTYSCIRSAMALSRCRVDARVVIVDLNLAHSDISQQVGDPPQGWVDLIGVRGAAGAADQLCVPFQIGTNIWALPTGAAKPGQARPRPASFSQILEVLRCQYELVLIDCPPILMSPQAMLLAKEVDGLVLILEAGRTRKPVVSQVIRDLKEAGANVIGAVVNKRQFYIPSWLYNRLF